MQVQRRPTTFAARSPARVTAENFREGSSIYFRFLEDHCANVCTQEAKLSQGGRAVLRVCIASIQNVERSLLLLVVSASDILLRTVKFFSVLFSSAYSSMRVD